MDTLSEPLLGRNRRRSMSPPWPRQSSFAQPRPRNACVRVTDSLPTLVVVRNDSGVREGALLYCSLDPGPVVRSSRRSSGDRWTSSSGWSATDPRRRASSSATDDGPRNIPQSLTVTVEGSRRPTGLPGDCVRRFRSLLRQISPRGSKPRKTSHPVVSDPNCPVSKVALILALMSGNTNTVPSIPPPDGVHRRDRAAPCPRGRSRPP